MNSDKKRSNTRRFKKILIANRGEIVLRIIKACKQLRIKTVAMHAKDDRNKIIESASDEYVPIYGNSLNSTYLNIDKIIKVAKQVKADAIHPGYGFLAENPSFARACEQNKIRFIGPSSSVLEKVAHKIEARKLSEGLGIATVHGSEILQNEKDVVKFVKEMGYPIILKSCSGGGGRGIRIVKNRKELRSCFNTAMNEVLTSFGSQSIYAEKYIKARHIEFQFLADKYGNVIHLFDRECSIQRRFQKLVEEAPACAIPIQTRKRMGRIACLLTRRINYVGVGTVEFLFTPKNKFYFLEVNPRIQVEHGVTEMVTGIDIVKEQIRIAQGRPLSIKQDDIRVNGHSIECRIVAEQVRKNFAPSGGTVRCVTLARKLPSEVNEGCRFRTDTALHPGLKINPSYDSLLAKLIVWGKTRKSAIKAMNKALDATRIEGVANTVCFYKFLINHKDFIQGKISTDFISDKEIVNKYSKHSLSPEIIALISSAIYQHETKHSISFSKPSRWVEKVRKESVGIVEES